MKLEMAEPNGSPPGGANHNHKQSLIVSHNHIPNPYTSRNPLLKYGDFLFSTWRPLPRWIFKMWKF